MTRKQLREMLEPVLPRQAGALRPEEVKQLLDAGQITPIDTREAAVYNRAHIEGAQSFPIEEIESRLAELHMLPNTPVLYCRSGDKTKELAAKLASQGTPVAYMEGGVLNWEATGYELFKP